jgi:hypothetical protein
MAFRMKPTAASSRSMEREITELLELTPCSSILHLRILILILTRITTTTLDRKRFARIHQPESIMSNASLTLLFLR